MSEAIKPLEEVRREIDEIDAALHDLIMRRTCVVEQVIAAKGTTNTGNFIPGREIKVLRGLMQRHEGAFPRHALIRMWREMISVFAAMQGPFHVVACAEEGDQGWSEQQPATPEKGLAVQAPLGANRVHLGATLGPHGPR